MTDSEPPFEHISRGRFLNLAGMVEGAVLVLGLVLGWCAGIRPLDALNWSWSAMGVGVLATLPPFALFLLFFRWPVGPLRPIRSIVIDMLGPPLAACRWYDLVLLGAMAGFCEEVLFRGFLQAWLAGDDLAHPRSLGFLVALVGSNLLFALAHPVTRTYAVLAGLIGCYLGLLPLLDIDPETHAGNLVIPVVTHGLYDVLAFFVVARVVKSGKWEVGSGEDH